MSQPLDPGPFHKESGELSNMQVGDVLVTHTSSVLEHDISIVPEKAHATAATRRDAVEQAAGEAQERAVDAWVTDDQIHVVRLATHRSEIE